LCPEDCADRVVQYDWRDRVPEERLVRGSGMGEIISEIVAERVGDKFYYLDLLHKQFRQLREMGFVGPDAVELLTRNKFPFLELDLNTLKAVAQGAGALGRQPPD